MLQLKKMKGVIMIMGKGGGSCKAVEAGLPGGQAEEIKGGKTTKTKGFK